MLIVSKGLEETRNDTDAIRRKDHQLSNLISTVEEKPIFQTWSIETSEQKLEISYLWHEAPIH